MADFQTALPVRIVSADGISQEYDTSRNQLDGPRSLNNRLVVEAYQKQGLQSSVSNGFAFIQQKVTVKGLVILMDAKLDDGTFIPKGSTAYIKEESLHNSPWAREILESEFLTVPFIIVNMANVEFVTPPPGTAA